MLTADVRASDRGSAYDSVPLLILKNAFVSFLLKVDGNQDIEKRAREVLLALESVNTLTDTANSCNYCGDLVFTHDACYVQD